MDQISGIGQGELDEFIEKVPVGLYWLNETGHVLWANSATLSLLGYTKEEFVGHHIRDLHLEPLGAQAILESLSQGKPVENYEARLKCKDGSVKIVLLSSNACKEEEAFVHARCVIRDITERKKSEASLRELTERLKGRGEELALAKDTAEKANRAKSEFLANVSHEIRTPLGAILGFAELLQNEKQTPSERVECISAILRNGRHLHQIVNDILDLSKMESQTVEITRSMIKLSDFLREVALFHQPLSKTRNLRFKILPCGKLPTHVETDPVRLRQILINVIGNAFKFTKAGSVTVTVRYRPSKSRMTGFLIFDVTDTGCGIPESETSRIFEPFVQVDSSTARRHGGTGLGLALSRKLTRLLGGNLRLVESVPQKGSTFSIRINIGQVDDASFSSFTNLRHQMIEQEGRDAGALPLLTGMKVLVCEDVSDNFRLIKYFLEPNQVALDWAPDGKSGIAKALQTTYDLILMDIQMPCMDGYEATRHLRENGYRGPIIALTGHAMREETDRCLAAGCDDHLTKPIDQNELLATLVKYTQTSMNAPPKEENFRQYIDCDAETLPVMQNFLKRKYPKHLLELETSVAKGDWQRVGDIAHQLKGSIGVFFDERVGTLSARIELEAKRQKPDMNELASLVSQLNDLDLPQHAG